MVRRIVDILPTRYRTRMKHTGIVVGGGKRATAFGFPTANIALGDAKLSGIYAARVTVGDTEYEAVAYADAERRVLESHLLGFTGELYGARISVELLKKLRDAMRFPDEATARGQIARDVADAQAYFARVR